MGHGPRFRAGGAGPAFLGCGVAGGSWPEEGVWVGKHRAHAGLPHGAAWGLGGCGGYPEPAALPLAEDLSMHLPCLPAVLGRCGRSGDARSTPVWEPLACGSAPNWGGLFFLPIVGTWPVPSAVFCPALGCRSPVAGGFARRFFCFSFGFSELSFGIFPHLAHFT